MDKDPTPTGQPVNIQFAGHLFFITQNQAGNITISFDDTINRWRYELIDFTLQKINYRTVLAALKGSHNQIISADLKLNSQSVYELTVKVAYQFLPEIREILVFERRQIAIEESEQSAVRNMRNYLKGLRDQLSSLGNAQVYTGRLDENGDTQIFSKLQNSKSVYTLGLNIVSSSSITIKPQMYYFSSITKQKKTSGAIPQQGIYLHSNTNCYIEIKFYAVLQDFDMILFRLPGKYVGEYTLVCERVEQI